MDEITHRFPELFGPLSKLASDVILDGEIVPAREDLILPFSELQKRLGRKTVSEELLSSIPVVFVVYDILYADGRVLIDESFAERRRLLEKIIPETGTVRLSEAKRFKRSRAA